MSQLFLQGQNSKVPNNSESVGSNPFLIYGLILTLLAIVNLYLIIKFFINFKRSINKTKAVLDGFLFKKYIQGLNIKSTAFYNIVTILVILAIQIIFSSVSLSKVYSYMGTATQKFNSGLVTEMKYLEYKDTITSYIPLFITFISFAIVLLISFGIAFVVIYYISFNYPQYKHKNEAVYNEIISLKELKKQELAKYPEKINIEFDKLKSSNLLLSNVLLRWMKFYNNMEQIKFDKQYNLFLNQLFKVEYFAEVQNEIKSNAQKISDIAEFATPIHNQDLSKIEQEIIWMNKMDKKAKILNETKELAAMSKAEFNKKYEEYVYTARANDPLYQSATKNSWLFYRDNEVEDLFFNPHSNVSYYYEDSNIIYEKELIDFMHEYKQFLISKFLATK
ncbi:hypothetical protein [Mycoplasma sp. 327]